MTFKEIIAQTSTELGIPEEVVLEAYNSMWKFIRQTVEELPLKEELSEEEFNNLRTNFNLPSLGKLFVTHDHWIGVKKRFDYIKTRLNKDV